MKYLKSKVLAKEVKINYLKITTVWLILKVTQTLPLLLSRLYVSLMRQHNELFSKTNVNDLKNKNALLKYPNNATLLVLLVLKITYCSLPMAENKVNVRTQGSSVRKS